jgi:hypothetical protein
LSVGKTQIKMSRKNEKYLQYAVMITGAIGSMFEEDSEWAIDQEELMEGDNLTHFMHALANVAPAHLFNNLTGDNKNQLEFNHVANQLCFQYMNSVGEKEE